MTGSREVQARPEASDDEMDALLAVSRVFVAVNARSIAAVAEVADPLQVRALVVLAGRGSVSLGELAEATGIHLTRASRLCDRMVAEGLIDRADDPANRRQLVLTISATGKQVVGRVRQRQRQLMEPLRARLRQQVGPHRRAELVLLLRDLAAAAGDPSDADLWSMGWPA